MTVDEAALEGVEFFKLLDAEERGAWAEVVDLIRLSAGETLFRAGEPGESLYLVRSGEVELEVAHLHDKADHLHEEMLRRFDRLEKTVARLGAEEKI